MQKKSAAQLARILKRLVTVTIVINLIALLFVPMLVGIRSESPLLLSEDSPPLFFVLFAVAWQYWFRVWRVPVDAVLTLFLLACGVLTAIILLQGRRLMQTIENETPFCEENRRSLNRAAVCCFLISLFALLRVVWGMVYFQSLAPLLTYCGLFIPVFALIGLLCLVMAALFQHATEMQAESDLTI